MPDASPRQPSRERTPSLTDRVLGQVHDARRSVARIQRRKRRGSSNLEGTPEQAQEARSLRRVFIDLGDSYRRYRRKTGAAISPQVRDAAVHFRKDPSVTSLVSVAAQLDELKILTW